MTQQLVDDECVDAQDDSRVENSVPSAPPTVVAWLGYAGLIPFIGLALIGCCTDRGRSIPWHTALKSYGAVILTFVGALHWGFAITIANIPRDRTNKLFVWSVVPALIAWIAISLNSAAAEILLIAGFATHYWQDRSLAAVAGLPGWYLPLRLRLSLVASFCLAVGAMVAHA